jgi:hypothetical protein
MPAVDPRGTANSRPTPPERGLQDYLPLIGKTEGEKKDTGDRPSFLGRLGAATAIPLMGVLLNLITSHNKYELSVKFLDHYVTGRGEPLKFDVPKEWQQRIAQLYPKPGIYKNVSSYEWGIRDLKNALGHFHLKVRLNNDGSKQYVITDRYQFSYKPNDKFQRGRHGFELPGLDSQRAERIRKLLPDTEYQNPGGFKEKFELRKVSGKWTLYLPWQFLVDWGVDFDLRGEFSKVNSQSLRR